MTDSIRQRLLNISKEQGVNHNQTLQRYTAERFLYRLSISTEADSFTLKGASLFLIWSGEYFRPTKDVDLLGQGDPSHESVRESLQKICQIKCTEDGVTFDAANILIEDIRHDQEYQGVRAHLKGTLGKTRLTLQVDIGFGDAITPARREAEFPTLLQHNPPKLWVYPRETSVAEKFEAMVRMGPTNSRLKDFWDVATMARRYPFDGEVLLAAVKATFERRQTIIPTEMPEALQASFYNDSSRQQQWAVFVERVKDDRPFAEVGHIVCAFLTPVFEAALKKNLYTDTWPAGGPWQH